MIPPMDQRAPLYDRAACGLSPSWPCAESHRPQWARDDCPWGILAGIRCFEVPSSLSLPERPAKEHWARWARHVRLHERFTNHLRLLIGRPYVTAQIVDYIEAVIDLIGATERFTAPPHWVGAHLEAGVVYIEFYVLVDFPSGASVRVRAPIPPTSEPCEDYAKRCAQTQTTL